MPIKDHFAGNAVKLFRIRQLLSNGVAVLLQIARQAAGVLNRLQQQIDGIPRQRADIIGNVAVFGIVFVNKFFGFALRASGGVMRAEKETVAICAAQPCQFRRSPAIAADNRLVPALFMRLFDNQRHFVVILRREQNIRVGFDDIRQLRAEVAVFCREGFKGDH